MANENIRLEVFTNAVPNLKLIPKELAETILATLEQQIVEWVKDEAIETIEDNGNMSEVL